jgi:hypothetical protein
MPFSFVFWACCLMQARNKASYLLQGPILRKTSGDAKGSAR